MEPGNAQKKYWQANLWVIGMLLGIWAVISFGCSVILVEPLNQYRFLQLPLGYWIANQGSMLVFVLLILAYALVSDLLERRYQRESAAEAGKDV